MSDASSVDSITNKTKKKKSKKEKIIPHINDIVSGRGSGSNRHEGNLYFRKLIRENKQLYLSRSKNEKMQVARDIYKKIESLNPPGRFLQKNPETGTWFKIGLSRALEKISQALREKNTKHQSQSSPHHHQQTNSFVAEQQGQNFFLDGNTSNDVSFGSINQRNLSIHGSSNYANATSALGQPTMAGSLGLPNDFHTHNSLSQQFRPNDVSDARALQFAHELRHFRETLGEPRQRLGLGRYESNPYDAQRLPLSGPQMLDQGINPSRIQGASHNHQSFLYDSSSMPLPSLPRVPHMRPAQESRTLFPHQQPGQRNLFQQQQNVEQFRALQALERGQQLLNSRSRYLDSQLNIPPTQRFMNDALSPMGNSYLPFSTPMQPTNTTNKVTPPEDSINFSNYLGGPGNRLSETLPYNPNHHFLGSERPPQERKRKKKNKKRKQPIQSQSSDEGNVPPIKKITKPNSSDSSLSSQSSGTNSLIGSNEKDTTKETEDTKAKSDKNQERKIRVSSSCLEEDSVKDSECVSKDTKDQEDITFDERESDKSPPGGLEALSAAASLMRE